MDPENRKKLTEWLASMFADGFLDREITDYLQSSLFTTKFGRRLDISDLVAVIKDLMVEKED